MTVLEAVCCANCGDPTTVLSPNGMAPCGMMAFCDACSGPRPLSWGNDDHGYTRNRGITPAYDVSPEAVQARIFQDMAVQGQTVPRYDELVQTAPPVRQEAVDPEPEIIRGDVCQSCGGQEFDVEWYEARTAQMSARISTDDEDYDPAEDNTDRSLIIDSSDGVEQWQDVDSRDEVTITCRSCAATYRGSWDWC